MYKNFQIPNKPSKMPKDVKTSAKVSKFRRIWSHCSSARLIIHSKTLYWDHYWHNILSRRDADNNPPYVRSNLGIKKMKPPPVVVPTLPMNYN